MKIKYVILLLVLLGACTHGPAYPEPAAVDPVISEPIAPAAPVATPQPGLHAVQTFSNEFGVGFTLRNTTPHRLYYNDHFRIDGTPMVESNNPAGLQYIRPGDSKSTHVSWGESRPTGLYHFQRDFFLDKELSQLYTTLDFPFDIVGWYHPATDAPPLPEAVEDRRNQRAQEQITFMLASGPSEIIRLASPISVSRNEIRFDAVNITSTHFFRGSSFVLWQYADGMWEDVAPPQDFLFTGDAWPALPGEIDHNHINFAWNYGTLPTGLYKLVRTYYQDRLPPGAPRVQELLFAAFVIDDTTPDYLSQATAESIAVTILPGQATPTSLAFSIINDSPYALTFHSPFIVEKYVYGIWQAIYEKSPPTRHTLDIPPSETIQAQESWETQLGKLPPGQYQLIAYLAHPTGGQVITQPFHITSQIYDSYTGATPLNPMFAQPMAITHMDITPTALTITWKNTTDQIYYTPWPSYWIERYTPGQGREFARVHEASDSVFHGSGVNLRTVNVDMVGGGLLIFDTTPVAPGQYVLQTIDWGWALPPGQYVISLPHFTPLAPGFKYWIAPWERFSLLFEIC